MQNLTMPLGNSDFKEIRETGLYYVDKTMLIDQLVGHCGAKVTLITRPRRFGKSLNMSMLQHFFDIKENSKELFDGLSISENKELCDNWMNQYPTILVSFKDVGGSDYETAFGLLKEIILKLYEQHQSAFNADLTIRQKMLIDKFFTCEANKVELSECLVLLSNIMYHHYGRPVILLIDEYDVPMAKGDANGYYREITDIMRYMLSKVLKDNPYIKMAVLTGCLRIAEESIFTGLNNLSIKSITDTDYDECFGFTNAEMDKLLKDTELMDKQPVFKEWYDGYIFGSKEVYCPWDVLNYVDALQKNPSALPVNYWANTSSNDAVKRFLESDFDVTDDFETLLSGGYVEKKINPNITYGDLTKDEMNLWSVLYMTGYLTILPGSLPTMTSNNPDELRGLYELPFKLRLPNKEVKILFEDTIAVWFKNKLFQEDRTELLKAVWSGDDKLITDELCGFLGDSISFYDYHEIFYHAFLAGLLTGIKGISVKSNREAGTGRADVILQYPRKGLVAIFEFKCAKSEEAMSSKCAEALKQIESRKYAFPFRHNTIIKYGIAFFEKQCLVKKG